MSDAGKENTSFTAALHPLAWSLYALVGGAAPCSTQGSLGMFMCTVYTPAFAVNRMYVCPQNANTAKLIQEYCMFSLENAWLAVKTTVTSVRSGRMIKLECQCVFKNPEWTKLQQLTGFCLSNFNFVGHDGFNPSLSSFRKLGQYFRSRSAELFQKRLKWHWNFFFVLIAKSHRFQKDILYRLDDASSALIILSLICSRQCYLKCLRGTERCM